MATELGKGLLEWSALLMVGLVISWPPEGLMGSEIDQSLWLDSIRNQSHTLLNMSLINYIYIK